MLQYHLPSIQHCMSAAVLAAGLIANLPAAAQPAETLPAETLPATIYSPVKRALDWPPSANLHYQVKARQSGLKFQGNSLVEWHLTGKKYRISAETHAMMVGRILTASSEGSIDQYGLAPAAYSEKRFRKGTHATHFNRGKKIISFSASGASYPLTGGEQDRTSITWQLIANARGAPKKFTAGSSWQYFVAGQRDADIWTFNIGKTEKIATPLGPVDAVRIARLLPPDSRDQQLDIWLAPSLEWYPVKLRFAEPDGNFIEQVLERIDKR